jgi:predicted RNA-binding Zn-ribbon protein involved in translation (DUF1610 family)
MKCPRCGAEMNHHADKLIEPTSQEEAERMDAALGGMVEEMFACPNCGYVDSRRAEPGSE